MMNHDKMKEFSKVTAIIGSSMSGLLQAQDLMMELMCKECDIPLEMKEGMIEDMNKVIGIQKCVEKK